MRCFHTYLRAARCAACVICCSNGTRTCAARPTRSGCARPCVARWAARSAQEKMELLAQQAALQRKAATLVKKRAPRPGWFEDKTPAFTRELIRLNKLNSWNDPLSLIAEPAKHAWTPASVA